MNVQIFKTNENAILPVYGTQLAACFDLSACLKGVDSVLCYNAENEKYMLPVVLGQDFAGEKVVENFAIIIRPQERVLVPTGLIFDIPVGKSLRLHPRSGNALKFGITLPNAEGIVDEDYVKESFGIIHNTSNKSFVISHGDRIMQGEFVDTPSQAEFEVTTDIIERKSDRDGGLGSTGNSAKIGSTITCA